VAFGLQGIQLVYSSHGIRAIGLAPLLIAAATSPRSPLPVPELAAVFSRSRSIAHAGLVFDPHASLVTPASSSSIFWIEIDHPDRSRRPRLAAPPPPRLPGSTCPARSSRLAPAPRPPGSIGSASSAGHQLAPGLAPAPSAPAPRSDTRPGQGRAGSRWTPLRLAPRGRPPQVLVPFLPPPRPPPSFTGFSRRSPEKVAAGGNRLVLPGIGRWCWESANFCRTSLSRFS
jgi:hypothetical protein